MYHYKSGSSSARQRNAIKWRLAAWWRADDEPALNTSLVAAIFQEIRTCIARNPYSFLFFRGGPDPLSPRLLIRPSKCIEINYITIKSYFYPSPRSL